jgi:hypothetical protein
VYERSRLKGVLDALAAQQRPGDPPQLVVDQFDQPQPGALIAAGELFKDPRNLAARPYVHGKGSEHQ